MGFWTMVTQTRKMKQQNKYLMRELRAAHYPTYVELKTVMGKVAWVAAGMWVLGNVAACRGKKVG